jgi:membrane-bound metal-dependent hydrolase YbcI (DUF457 family)
MFVGHLALAFASKPVAPRLSLGWLVAAVTAADLIWPVLLLAGVERATIAPGHTAFTPFRFDHYPWSHSLLLLVVWGVALALLARRTGTVGAKAGWLLAALVVSHWLLDVITHAPDMPLWPGASPRFGLALWNSIPATFVIEGALWIAALAIYLRQRRPTGRAGAIAFWSFVLITTVMWAAGPWSPPPENTTQLGLFALIGWITIPWAAFADRRFAETRSSP